MPAPIKYTVTFDVWLEGDNTTRDPSQEEIDTAFDVDFQNYVTQRRTASSRKILAVEVQKTKTENINEKTNSKS